MALISQSPIRDLPGDFTFRGATQRDIPVIAGLFNQRMIRSAGELSSAIQEMRIEWQTPRFNPAMDVRLVFDRRERLAGYIEVWTTPEMRAQPWIWGCVHPDFENRGIGTALLRWAEARARLALYEMPENMPIAAQFGACHNLATAPALCRSLGWQPANRGQSIHALALGLSSARRLLENQLSGWDIYEKTIFPADFDLRERL